MAHFPHYVMDDVHRISMNVIVYYLSKVQEFLVRLKKCLLVLFVVYGQFLNIFYVLQSQFVIFQSPLQLEAMSKKDHSIDMEGAQQAIQLVTTITD